MENDDLKVDPKIKEAYNRAYLLSKEPENSKVVDELMRREPDPSQRELIKAASKQARKDHFIDGLQQDNDRTQQHDRDHEH